MLWHPKNLYMSIFWSKNELIYIFLANFVKNGHFLVRNDLRSGLVLVSRVILLCLLKEQTRPRRSFLTQKMAFFHKIYCKNSNSFLLVKVLSCPNFLDVRASTNVKRGQNSNLNLIKIQSEPKNMSFFSGK